MNNKCKLKPLGASIFLIFAIILSSCKKDDYQPKGDYITKGDNNNTVMAYTFTASSWTLEGSFWYYQYSLPSSVSLDGIVMVYIQSGTTVSMSGSFLLALPFTNNDIEYYYVVKPSISSIELDVRSASGETAIYNPGEIDYKVVVIPPAVSRANPNINLNDYNEVKKAFNLN